MRRDRGLRPDASRMISTGTTETLAQFTTWKTRRVTKPDEFSSLYPDFDP